MTLNIKSEATDAQPQSQRESLTELSQAINQVLEKQGDGSRFKVLPYSSSNGSQLTSDLQAKVTEALGQWKTRKDMGVRAEIVAPLIYIPSPDLPLLSPESLV